jgi:hypothetical protein
LAGLSKKELLRIAATLKNADMKIALTKKIQSCRVLLP